jgi:hypothetical protein
MAGRGAPIVHRRRVAKLLPRVVEQRVQTQMPTARVAV